jgi:hypothetical protein
VPGFFVRFEDLNMSASKPILIPEDPNDPIVFPDDPIVIPDDPAPVAAVDGIEWCADRHDKSALTTLLPAKDALPVYHIGGFVYAVQVAEVGVNKLRVVVRDDGNVDWLLKSEADAYRKRYLEMVSRNTASTLGRQQAQKLADAWIQEHRAIESGAAREQDFAAGRPYVNTGIVYRSWN